MHNNAEEFVKATQKIHRAFTIEDIASALVQGVMNGVPGSTRDWRLRIMSRSAIAGMLRQLKLGHAQRHAASAEMAFDFRLEKRDAVMRVLRSCAGEIDDEARTALLHLADTAVRAATGQRHRGDALRAAAQGACGPGMVAYASMNGSLFIPANVRRFAQERGVNEDDLTTSIAESARPLRRACETEGVCRIGQLRFSRRLPNHDVVLRSSLDPAAQDEYGPIICVRVLDARSDDAEIPGTESSMDQDTIRNTYSARLLRQLVS